MARATVSHGSVKTYWHLRGERRIPTSYEIASTQLLYYPGRGFAVETPAAAWMRAHGAQTDLTIDDWDRFADPAGTTYADYVRSRSDRAALIAGALRLAQEQAQEQVHGDRAPHGARACLLGPMRYAWHGLQMVSAYQAHLAPGSRIAIAALFQTADLLHAVEAVDALWRSECGTPQAAASARAAWEGDALWQPTRAVIERLLIAYRWSECFAALNLVVKPALDAWLLQHLSERARAAGDEATRLLLWSLYQETHWHREWAVGLARRLAAGAANRRVLTQAVRRWRDEIAPLAASFAPIFDTDLPQRRTAVDAALDALQRAAGLTASDPASDSV
jgi:toluene monooxygenase system protein E